MGIRLRAGIRVGVRLGTRIRIGIRVWLRTRIRVRVRVRIGVGIGIGIGFRIRLGIRIRLRARLGYRRGIAIRLRVRAAIARAARQGHGRPRRERRPQQPGHHRGDGFLRGLLILAVRSLDRLAVLGGAVGRGAARGRLLRGGHRLGLLRLLSGRGLGAGFPVLLFFLRQPPRTRRHLGRWSAAVSGRVDSGSTVGGRRRKLHGCGLGRSNEKLGSIKSTPACAP